MRRCNSATQTITSATATVCRSSSTHVLSYARHSIISINDFDSSKRFTRLRQKLIKLTPQDKSLVGVSCHLNSMLNMCG
ncbi:hypothetical protein ACLKA6_018771 [Drosophila palustris]